MTSQMPNRIPEPDATDPEDVATALEMAVMYGNRSDTREAVRWLRRAAEAASEAGADARALELARLAADLSSSVDEVPRSGAKPPPLPTTTPLPPGASTAPAVGTPSSTPVPPNAAATPLPPVARPALALAATNERASARGDGRTSTMRSESGPSLSPRPPTARPLPPSARPPEERVSQLPERSSRVPANGSPSATPLPAGARGTMPPASHPSVAAAARKSVAPAPAATTAKSRQTLRVSVQPSNEEKGLLLVRVLEEGEAAPKGAHEALLVGLEAGAQLTARKS